MDKKVLLLWMIYPVLSIAAAPESFNTTPPPIVSSFSCAGRPMGFYADAETNCRAYHTCDDHGNHFMNYCPVDTAFRQDATICDHAYLVDCQANIDSVSQRLKIGQDNSHDAPPQSFVELHGEGTSVRGFARSFRINPDSKSSSSTKHPTFVLNSSVFLKDASTEQKVAALPRALTKDNDFFAKTVTRKDYSQNPFLASYAQATASHESITTKPIYSLSQELQPPVESTTSSEKISQFRDEDFSFLLPPPIRNDNVHFSNNLFATPKVDNFKSSNSRSPVTSTEFSNTKKSNNFEKDYKDAVTFTPPPTMILEMMKARSLDQTSDSNFSKPSKFLLPPTINQITSKSGVSASARSNFNFRNDNYPYVETLRSIQNNQVTTSTTPAPLRIHVTDASIFAVPTKTLAPAKEFEKDPYYPKPPTSTETYFTSRIQSDKPRKPHFTTTRRPFTSNAKFEIPAVLPDLNSLEDLLDRRKFFFIPQIKS